MTAAVDPVATPVPDATPVATPAPDALPDAALAAHGGGARSSRLRRLWRGRPDDPAWVRPALLTLLTAAALLYLIGLGRSGWANAFYSAAVQAGAHSWKAFFFGSSDAANFITVDKPPASLWVMDLSARLFGVNSWSILVPQALEGVACVGVLYLTVRRWFGPAAGLLAGLVLALTPVATLMFRFNNPDALLVALLTLGAYAVTRALENAGTRWLVLAAALIGLGFTTKMLQALLVVPALVAAYAIAAPASPWRRARQLVVAGVALFVSCGWWVAVAQLWPAASRPYIGGSQANSVVELIFGYNGLGRITGNETGSVVAGGAGQAGAWGATGIGRLFSSSWGGQIAWLLPAALAFLAALLWLSRRAPRTDRLRAAAVLWGGALLVTAVVFSFAQGIIHEYYAVALAPAIGALVGIGATTLWAHRSKVGWRLCLAGIVAATAVWAFVLLDRSPTWLPWLRVVVVGGGLPAAALLIIADRLSRRAALTLAGVGVALALTGPAVYSVQTASAAHSGSLPTAGPTVAGGRGGGLAGPGRGGGGLRFAGALTGSSANSGGAAPTNGAPSASQDGGAPSGTRNGGGAPSAPAGAQGDGGFGGNAAAGGRTAGNAGGGLLDASTPSSALVALLKHDADHYTWVAATVGAQSAAGYQLAADDPVMSLGGFNGSDPYPTLAEFEALVNAGKVHYFIGGGSGGGGSSMSSIGTWVKAHFTSRTVGGITLYDLTSRVG